MKRSIQIFKDFNYTSLSTGGAQVYLHDESLCDMLGNADAILLQFMGTYQSNASARAKIVVYQSAKTGLRPKDGTWSQPYESCWAPSTPSPSARTWRRPCVPLRCCLSGSFSPYNEHSSGAMRSETGCASARAWPGTC